MPSSPLPAGHRHDRAADTDRQIPRRRQSGQWEGNAAAADTGSGRAGGGGKAHPSLPPRAYGCSHGARVGINIPIYLGVPRCCPALTPRAPHPQPSSSEEEAARRVDDLLESYMGIRDSELGEEGAWTLTRRCPYPYH